MQIKRRSFSSRLMLAPGHFMKQLAIGRGRVPFLSRLRAAWAFTLILLRS